MSQNEGEIIQHTFLSVNLAQALLKTHLGAAPDNVKKIQRSVRL